MFNMQAIKFIEQRRIVTEFGFIEASLRKVGILPKHHNLSQFLLPHPSISGTIRPLSHRIHY